MAETRAVVLPHDAAIAGGIFDFGGKNRGRGVALIAMRAERGECFGADQRRVARQNHREFRARSAIARRATSMAWPVPRCGSLQHGSHAERRDRRA